MLRMTLDNSLARKIEDPAWDLSDNEVVRTVRKLVEFDGFEPMISCTLTESENASLDLR